MRRTRDADIHIKRHDRSGRAKVSKIFLYVSVTSSNIEYVVSAYDEENNEENDCVICSTFSLRIVISENLNT